MPLTKITHEDLLTMQEDVSFKKADYLRANGWKTTCEVPGAFWVWVREYRGQRLMAGLDLAVDMQGWIDEFSR